jgi:hypothetical protein
MANRDLLFKYIDDNINTCPIDVRKQVYAMILAEVGRANIQKQPNGIHVFLDKINTPALEAIKIYLEGCIQKDMIDFSDIRQ